MINPGYKLSVSDIKELKDFKKSEAYSTYLKAISQSPAFVAIMDEHINNVDISKDIDDLKQEGKLPSTISTKSIAGLFKTSLGRMAICILADSIILKELEECKVESVIADLKKDSDIIYLLGQADKKYYIQAATLAEAGKLDSTSLAFRGLMAYMKLHQDEFKEPQDACDNLLEEDNSIFDEPPIHQPRKRKKKNVDVDSDTIIL